MLPCLQLVVARFSLAAAPALTKLRLRAPLLRTSHPIPHRRIHTNLSPLLRLLPQPPLLRTQNIAEEVTAILETGTCPKLEGFR